MGKCIDCANFISPDVKNMGKTIHCKKFGECSHGAQKYLKCFVGKYDIKSRARKAAEEIMDKVFMPGETVNAERLEKLIYRHFSEGEE